VERLKKELSEEIASEKTGKSNVIKCIGSLLEVSTMVQSFKALELSDEDDDLPYLAEPPKRGNK
jgi:hypothetical protein